MTLVWTAQVSIGCYRELIYILYLHIYNIEQADVMIILTVFFKSQIIIIET